jgi:hypothetical protein
MTGRWGTLVSPCRKLVAKLLWGVLLVSLLSCPTVLSEVTVSKALQLQGHAVADGSVEVLADSGAVHYSLDRAPSEFRLEASHLSVHLDWKNGTSAGSPAGDDRFGVRTDSGERVDQFENVTVELEPAGKPEILAYPGQGDLRYEADGIGSQRLSTGEDSHVTRVGASPSSEGTNDSQQVGFWFEPDPTWITGNRLDTVRASGDFSLFLNNMTVTIRQGTEVVWQNWTGYREEETGPASSYQRHLLLVHVTNGALNLSEDDGLTVFGPVLDVQADGTVTAQTATGHLALDETTYAFDDDPLRMEGEGRFQVRESSTGPAPGLFLMVDDGSQLDVHGGQRVDPSPGIGEAGLGWGLWVPVSLLGLAVAGGIAHRAGYTTQVLDRWRSDRYTKWMTRGRELANAADYDQAATCFRRATRAQPVKGVAWYHLAIALLEDGRSREVLDVVDEARRGEAVIDELDFLDLEAQAARRAGEHERCREAVARLADGSEAMATTLVRDLGLSEEVLGHELATRLSWEEDEEALPGYV